MKKPKMNKLKTTIVIEALVIGLLTASIIYVTAQGGTTWTISQGIYPGIASYTIWKEGSTYYAKNAYGQIDFSDSNATTIINSASSSAPIGARIFFKAGLYVIDGIISLKEEQHLEGESRGKHLDYSSSTILSLTQADATLNLVDVEGIRLTHLTIDGNNVAIGISLGCDSGYKSSSYIFTDLFIRNCTYGIFNDVPTTGFYDSGFYSCYFYGNLVAVQLKELMINFYQCMFTTNKVAIEYCQSTTGFWASFYGSIFSRNDYDFNVSSTNNIALYLSNSWFENEGEYSIGKGNGLGYGNVFLNSSGMNVGTKGIIFEHCQFSKWSNINLEWVDYGSYQYRNVVFRECFFSNQNNMTFMTVHSGRYPTFEKSFRGTTAAAKVWLTSRNSGVATISASTSVTVTHGVITTPTEVVVTLGTTGAGDYYVDTLTSTQFTIHVANSGTYTAYWVAEYNPT